MLISCAELPGAVGRSIAAADDDANDEEDDEVDVCRRDVIGHTVSPPVEEKRSWSGMVFSSVSSANNLK